MYTDILEIVNYQYYITRPADYFTLIGENTGDFLIRFFYRDAPI